MLKYNYIIYLFLWPVMASAQVQHYSIDAQASVFSFKVEHFGVATVNGSFSAATGNIYYNASHPDSLRADVSIEVESIDTNNSLRDKELKSEDFLDAGRYPSVSFSTTTDALTAQPQPGASTSSNGSAVAETRIVRGNMSLYGKIREIDVPVEIRLDPTGSLITVHSDFTLSRKDYGIKFGILMDSLVGDEIRISVSMVGRLTPRSE